MDLNIVKQAAECPIRFTDAAISQFKEAASTQPEDQRILRVGVKGGGCSGFMHSLEFISESGIDPDEDSIYLIGDLHFAIDCFSEPYLKSTTIDYIHSLQQSGFKFYSDEIKRTCGCGSSFST